MGRINPLKPERSLKYYIYNYVSIFLLKKKQE